MAAVSGIGDDALQANADLLGDFGNDLCQGMAVIRVARQGCDMRHELAAFAAVNRRCYRDFDAEFIGPVRLAFADAFHLGGMQAVNFWSTLSLALPMDPFGQCELRRKHRPQFGIVFDLAADITADPAELCS